MIEYLAYQTIPSTKRGCKGQFELKVEQAVRTCGNVKNRQTKAKDNLTEIVLNLIEEEKLSENKVIMVKLKPEMAADKNLTGLIANSLQEIYCRPIFILNYFEENGKVYWRGSARGYDKANLGSLRDLLETSGLVEYAEGHASAFGLSVPDENCKALVEYINFVYKDFDCSPTYSVDLIWGNKDLCRENFLEIAEQEKIWGKGVENPLIALEGIRLYGNQIRLYGLEKNRPTLNIALEDGSSLIKFKSSQEEFDKLYSEHGYVIINAVGECMKSSWGIPQFNITEYEIVGKSDYCF